MKRVFLLLSSIFIITSTTLFAQNKFEGEVEYQITYNNMAEALKPQESFLPKKMFTQISGNLVRSIQPSIGGDQISISNTTTKEAIILINAMGQKIALKTSEDDYHENTQHQDDINIEYSNETKNILGYKCKKAIIKNKDTDLIIYYTKELPTVTTINTISQLDGFPLQTILRTELFTSITTAIKIDKKSLNIKMEIPKDYRTISLEEFQNMFGEEL